jgi:hypothetical protein
MREPTEEEFEKIHLLALKILEVLQKEDQFVSDLAMIEAFVLPWSVWVGGGKEDAKAHGEWFCKALMRCLNFTMQNRANMVSGNETAN